MINRLPGGFCFAHGPYSDTIGCPRWPDCVTDPALYEVVMFSHGKAIGFRIEVPAVPVRCLCGHEHTGKCIQQLEGGLNCGCLQAIAR